MWFTTVTVQRKQRECKVSGESVQDHDPKVWAITRWMRRSVNKGKVERTSMSRGSEEGLEMPYRVDKHTSEHRHLQWGVMVVKSGWLWMPDKGVGLCLEWCLRLASSQSMKPLYLHLMFCRQKSNNLDMSPCYVRVSSLSNVTGAVKQHGILELERAGFEFWDWHLLTDDFYMLLNLSGL